MSIGVIDELYNELDFSQDKMFELEQRIDNIERYVKALLLLQLYNGDIEVRNKVLQECSKVKQVRSQNQRKKQEVSK
jgi:hypothetical protein